MIQKAGSADNTLCENGWQSADYWFTANLSSGVNLQVGQPVWVNLSASIIKHLSFTNYRVSTIREGGKACLGILSGGTISRRPDASSEASATLIPVGTLENTLAELPKTQVKSSDEKIESHKELSGNIKEEVAPESAVKSEVNLHGLSKAIDLPELPSGMENKVNVGAEVSQNHSGSKKMDRLRLLQYSHWRSVL